MARALWAVDRDRADRAQPSGAAVRARPRRGARAAGRTRLRDRLHLARPGPHPPGGVDDRRAAGPVRPQDGGLAVALLRDARGRALLAARRIDRVRARRRDHLALRPVPVAPAVQGVTPMPSPLQRLRPWSRAATRGARHLVILVLVVIRDPERNSAHACARPARAPKVRGFSCLPASARRYGHCPFDGISKGGPCDPYVWCCCWYVARDPVPGVGRVSPDAAVIRQSVRRSCGDAVAESVTAVSGLYPRTSARVRGRPGPCFLGLCPRPDAR